MAYASPVARAPAPNPGMQTNPATILIVDDNPNNLRVLEGILQSTGYAVRAALNGETALRAAVAARPELILLDIRMPQMDGFEVCRQLKTMPETREVPVIFISALQEVDDKLRAFKAGGVDYIVKPFQAEEVLTRARTHIELALSRRALAESNQRLEQQVEARTHELSEANVRLRRAMQEERALRELLTLSHNRFAEQDYPRQALQLLIEQLDWRPPEICPALLLNRSRQGDDHLELIMPVSAAPDQEWIRQATCRFTDIETWARDDGAIFETFNASFPLDEHSFTRCYPLMSGRNVLGLLFTHCEDPAQAPANMDELGRQVANVVGMGLARRLDDERLAWQAYHDALTGLPNRRQLEEKLGREIETARARQLPFGLMLIDLDHFKLLNEAMGHNIGDQLLVELARRLREVMRAGDTLFRWGGDEFVALLPDIATHEDEAVELLRAIATEMSQVITAPIRHGDQESHLQASIGIALYPNDGATPDELLKHLDLAMHRAKESGRNTVHFFRPEMQGEAERRVRLEKELRQAIAAEQFVLHLQAQVDNDGVLVGAEALIRWQHPERGMVPPGLFIPLAEETGLIQPMGEWVLASACRQLRAWADIPAARNICLAVNISARQFHQPNFVERVQRELEASGARASQLELEVTESLLLDDIDSAVRKMDALRELGIHFSVDDFGTGYSSLAYLKRLPVDQLKIDQSFVRNAHHDSRNAAIVRTIISLAKNLGMKTLAEGVEAHDELAFLRGAGCDHYQGYHFGRPEPLAEFGTNWLALPGND